MQSSILIEDELSPLELVVVGTSIDRGNLELYNATVSLYDQMGNAPSDDDLNAQVEGLCRVLEHFGIEVVRPENVPGVLQTFVRDLGVVIGDVLVWCNPKKQKRRVEQEGLRNAIAEFESIKTISVPSEIGIEGGDIVLLKGRVLVGIGTDPENARTSHGAADFLRKVFPNREVIPIEINASDKSGDNPRKHVLHLDCAFQPLGNGHGVFFEQGFKRRPEPILDLIGEKNLIQVSADEMFHLWPNLFSISPESVLSAPSFTRLNNKIRALGLNVIEVPYEEVAKLGGLFRCSTLPLRRRLV
jgi:N-dimethylarginine dimethylaminohydrolase